MSAETDFKDKKALVTGGSRGIGRATCLELARRGADLAFIYRNRDGEAEATATEVRALGRRALALRADLAHASAVGAAIDRAADELGRIDVLVHAAGAMVAWSETAELSTEDWDRYMAVDLSGAFYAIRASLPHLRRAGAGTIVAISSIAAQMCQPRNVQGAAAKAGLEAMVRVVAREEAKHGIRANAVAIGLAKIRRHGGDPWMLLPDNEVKQISAEDDFPDTWNAVRSGKIDRSDYLKQALEQAKRSPIKWSKELEAKLAPASASFKLFCDVCIYLQGMVGADGYILLPQVQLAELIGTAQGGISTYCVRAERAGLLRRVDPNWSWKKRKAIKWQCTATWQRTKA